MQLKAAWYPPPLERVKAVRRPKLAARPGRKPNSLKGIWMVMFWWFNGDLVVILWVLNADVMVI